MNYPDFLLKHPRLTRSLKKFILEQEPNLSKLQFEAFLNSLDQTLDQARKQLGQVPEGVPRARKLHSLVDQEIAQAHHIKASCQKGCSACCHIEVEITSYETEILATLINDGHQIDSQRLAEQSERAVGDSRWKKSSQDPSNQCIFLSPSGDCSIYDDRPVMCRRHSVTSPAYLCATLEAPVILRYFPMVDVLISSANEDLNLQIGPLAKILMKKLNKK